jgi:hypothetical protein
MSMSEYEERFRPLAPSLHQLFAETGGRRQAQRHRKSILVAVAAVGVVIVTCRMASPYAVDGWSSGHSRTTACQNSRMLSFEFGFPPGEPALDIQQPTERINGHK